MLQKKEQDENDDNRSEKLSNDADGSAGMDFNENPLDVQGDGYEGRGSGLQNHLEVKHEEEEEEKKEEDFNDYNFWKADSKLDDMDIDTELELDE